MTGQKSALVISLDFELYWGVRDEETIENYKENLLGVRFFVPSLLKLFDEYKIHATWLTVGFLFFETRDELIKELPAKKPDYVNDKLSSYGHINNIGSNEGEDRFHYAPSLIKMISSSPYQEIGSHTFSHYYCLERGQDISTFREDLEAAIKIAKEYNLRFESLAFPRNQVNNAYLPVCREMGIKAYRGNGSSWIYRARSGENESLLRRGLRVIDAYFNIFGHNSYSIDRIGRDLPIDIPSSRFLYPYFNRLKILELLQLWRILSDLTYAAKKGLVYHLWFHPHDGGADPQRNILFLKKILNHYRNLREIYGMESLNMGELAHRLIEKSNYER